MFKVFTFGLNDIFNPNNLEKINGIMNSFLNNVDINELMRDKENSLSNGDYEKKVEESNNFINLKQFEDMYLLTIDLKGVDLREVSIRYDPGIIEINLKRTEIEKSGFGILSNNILVKKSYNKKFDDIEDIDVNQVFRSVDNGVFSMIMQKKYSPESISNIVEVNSYEENVDK